MVNKSKLVGLAIIIVLLLLLSVSLVAAQYTTEKTTDVSIGSDGKFTATDSDSGVSYSIQGTPGAVGTVTADVYDGNPQPTATIPSGISLSRFVAITFNMNAADFSQATITISYSSSDVQNIQSPYLIYKYTPDTNSYVKLDSTVDTASKTITITLTSIDDPLLAIGGASNMHSEPEISASSWAILVGSVIAIVLLVAFAVFYFRRTRQEN
ncbi:MAG: hypothetical protein ABSA79_02320 [Candidatus Bathyarchaeia archaeon]|jgi:hypothetical protein